MLAAQGHEGVLSGVVACATATFALSTLYRQLRAKRARNLWLTRFWRCGLLALLAASLVLVSQGPALLAGALALGFGLPLLVIGMQLEIAAFLGWIELQRTGGAIRVPGIQRLLPDAVKARVFVLQSGAGVLLLAAVLWPQPVLSRLAGAAIACAYLALWWSLGGITRRCRSVLAAADAA